MSDLSEIFPDLIHPRRKQKVLDKLTTPTRHTAERETAKPMDKVSLKGCSELVDLPNPKPKQRE